MCRAGTKESPCIIFQRQFIICTIVWLSVAGAPPSPRDYTTFESSRTVQSPKMSSYFVCINFKAAFPYGRGGGYGHKDHLDAWNKALIDHEYLFRQGYNAMTSFLLRHRPTQTCHLGWRGDRKHTDGRGSAESSFPSCTGTNCGPSN